MKNRSRILSFLLVWVIAGLGSMGFNACKTSDFEEPILESAHFEFDTVNVIVGTMRQVPLTVAPSDYPLVKLIWSSSDSTVVSVGASGILKARKTGKSTLTIRNPSSKVTASCVVLVVPAPVGSPLPGMATDIGVGANGGVYITSTTTVSGTGGFSIQRWNGAGWTTMKECAGVRVAVAPDGTPWVVNKSKLIYRYNATKDLWDVYPGEASDIGIGADGSVYTLGVTEVSATGGFAIRKWNNATSLWTVLPECAAVRIAVGPDGTPWVVNKSKKIFRYTPGSLSWTELPGRANDIGIGPDGSVFIISNEAISEYGGYSIQKWTGSDWTTVSGAGTNISVGPQGARWWVDKSHYIFK